MNQTPITLTLQIHADGDHVAGEVSGPAGRRVPFSGRIGLMCAIDTFVANHADGPAQPCFGVSHTSEDTR